MVNALWKTWRELRTGQPGRRFRDSYDVRRERRSGAFSPARIVTIVIALVLIVGGTSIGWLPGPGGFVAIIGLAMIAQEFRPMARLLDRVELMLRAM